MDGHVPKNNDSTFPSFVDLDDFLTKHNSNFIWLLVGKSKEMSTSTLISSAVDSYWISLFFPIA